MRISEQEAQKIQQAIGLMKEIEGMKLDVASNEDAFVQLAKMLGSARAVAQVARTYLEPFVEKKAGAA